MSANRTADLYFTDRRRITSLDGLTVPDPELRGPCSSRVDTSTFSHNVRE